MQAVPAGGCCSWWVCRCRGGAAPGLGRVGDSISSHPSFSPDDPNTGGTIGGPGRSDPHHRGVRCLHGAPSSATIEHGALSLPGVSSVPGHCWGLLGLTRLRYLASLQEPREAWQWTAGQVRERGSLETSVSSWQVMSPGTSESQEREMCVRSGGFWSQALLPPRPGSRAQGAWCQAPSAHLGPAVAAFF